MTHVVTTPPGTRLRAVTRELADPGDLLDHLGPDGVAWLADDLAFVTAGRAAVVPARDARRTLLAIEHDPAPGPLPAAAGPIAAGALPFRGAGDGRLVVPGRIVGRDAAGRAWCTEIGPADGELDAPAVVATRGERRPAARYRIAAHPRAEAWQGRVDDALRHIESGALAKVVLAREVHVEADADFHVPVVLDRLRHDQPGCTAYADGGFVGASPELLVRRRGRAVESRPMAGTTARDGNPDDDDRAVAALAASAQEGDEHRLVVDAVLATLGDRCDRVRAVGPTATRFATVTHLATRVTGRLRDASLDLDALDLALALHPTPAVAGTPRPAALELIHELEPFDRGCYAGPVGWVHPSGDGDFAVALRCAELDGPRARLLAGGGIVAGSEPAAEWTETQAKLAPMLQALVRP